MACRLTIDLSPPLSPAFLPPEVYADLYKSYVSTYRALGFALMGRTNAPKSQPATPPPKDKAARPPKPVVAPFWTRYGLPLGRRRRHQQGTQLFHMLLLLLLLLHLL